MLRADLDLPWAPEVTLTDSSTTGYGVVTKNVSSEIVASAGRIAERWRYKATKCIRARAHALGLAQQSNDLAIDVATLEPLQLDLEPDSHDVEALFREVPSELVKGELKEVTWGQWRLQENILQTEARACCMGVRHRLRRTDGRRSFYAQKDSQLGNISQ